MEAKHFSHQHNLSLHQVEPGSEVDCSGRNSPGSASVYACWHCRFFLHEECFRASRSIAHPSHPSHPLTLMPYPTYPSQSFICNACGSTGSGFCFSCSHCDFDLHVHCASLENPPAAIEPRKQKYHSNLQIQSDPQIGSSGPDQALQFAKNTVPEADFRQQEPLPSPPPAPTIRHESHPDHPLTYYSAPPYDGGSFFCDACGSQGNEEMYHCIPCETGYDLHVGCANLTRLLTRKDHDHPLILAYKLPFEGQEDESNLRFICEVCCAVIPKGRWIYYCSECDYGTHLECAKAEADPQRQQMNKMLQSQKDFFDVQLKTADAESGVFHDE